MRKLLLFGGAGLAVLAFWWIARTRPVPVDVATVVRGAVRELVEEEARTKVVERYVISAPVAGRLQRVTFEAGDAVDQGAQVALIDPLPLKSRVEEAEANIRAIKERVSGVKTKKPKPQEIEAAQVLERKAAEEVEVAERQLAQLRAAEELAQREETRLSGLAREKRVAVSELDDAQSALRVAKERVRAQQVRQRIRKLEVSLAGLNRQVLESRASDFAWEERQYRQQIAGHEATLRSLRDELVRTRIQSPITGVVLHVHRESEQTVAAGTPLLEVADLSRLEIEADFLSEDVTRMRAGMSAEIFGRALGSTVLPALVLRVLPAAFEERSSLGVEQQRVLVRLAAEAGAHRLGDGFRVEVRVILDEREDALLVPEGALFRGRESWYVFRIEDGRARKVAVRIGIGDGRVREVLEGLSERDEVVLFPDDPIHDGLRVVALDN